MDEIIPGKHQILKDTKVIIQENKFNQVKLYMKNGVFEFTSIEYDKKIPSYRFNKDPIEVETYEIVFFDANDKQILLIIVFLSSLLSLMTYIVLTRN